MDLKPVHLLSRMVYEWEDSEFDEEAWLASAHPLDSHALEHPDVTALAAEHADGPAGALAWLAEHASANAPKVIRWVMAGAFKGEFEDEAQFCRDQFGDALVDHLATWKGAKGIGFPIEGDLTDCIDWDEVAHQTFDIWEDVFTSVESDGGVYVFDVSIDIDDYREEN